MGSCNFVSLKQEIRHYKTDYALNHYLEYLLLSSCYTLLLCLVHCRLHAVLWSVGNVRCGKVQ